MDVVLSSSSKLLIRIGYFSKIHSLDQPINRLYEKVAWGDIMLCIMQEVRLDGHNVSF